MILLHFCITIYCGTIYCYTPNHLLTLVNINKKQYVLQQIQLSIVLFVHSALTLISQFQSFLTIQDVMRHPNHHRQLLLTLSHMPACPVYILLMNFPSSFWLFSAFSF